MHSVKEYTEEEVKEITHVTSKKETKKEIKNNGKTDVSDLIKVKKSTNITKTLKPEEELKYDVEDNFVSSSPDRLSKRKNKKKTTFVLKDIDPTEVDKKYGISVAPNLQQTHIPKNVTAIEQLYPVQKQSFFIPFIDDNRKHCVTMIDSITKKCIQSYYCYWCRHSFSTVPIGCPVRYVNNKIIQMHISEITKEKYYIVHQVTENAKIDQLSNSKIIKNNYYETDGCFCSFNCCLAYITENIHNSLYINSKGLLMKMYSEIFETNKLVKIFPAPSWRLLKEYGGFMDITEFRNSFTNYIYINNNHCISKLPKIMPIGHVFEEHIIF